MGANEAWRVTGFVLRCFRMIWTFDFGKCYSGGAPYRFLIVLISIGTRAVLIMKASSGV